MPRFTIVMQEEQTWQVEAEDEAALRSRIEHNGPPSGWHKQGDQDADLIENHDTVISIRQE